MKLINKTWFRYLLNGIMAVLIYVVLQTLIQNNILSTYYAKLLLPIGFYIILAVSLNLTCGFLGQLPLGHAGFMAIGAYASAIVTKALTIADTNASFFIGLMVGGLIAAFFGVIIGLPALRLRGDYLAIITLGFGEIIKVIILNLDITGGAMGLKGIPKYTNFTWVYIWVVITIFAVYTLIHSRHGRAVVSIRENEIASESCGINTTYYKTMAFTVAAFFAGIAGGLYSHYIGILDATNFGFMKSVEILVMVVLGGMGSIFGSVISATVLTLLPELLRSFEDYRMVIYSLLLVIVMIFKPSGLMGTREFSFGKTIDQTTIKIRSLIGRKKGVETNEN